jgi:predicted permease
MLAALRVFRHRPGFAAGAALTLALGIGANVAVFSAVRAVLIEAPPYPDAEALVTLLPADHMQGTPFTGADVEALRALPAFSAVAACGAPDVVPLRSKPRVQAVGIQVTPDFFRLFGVAPRLGRLLTAEDFTSGGRNAVISYTMWRTLFAGDPQAIGQTITLNRQSWTVVGVMPQTFLPSCFDVEGAAQAWIPHVAPGIPVQRIGMAIIARLAPGIGIDAAQSQIDTVTSRMAVDTGDGRYQYAYLEPYGASATRELEPGLVLLQAVAGLLLLITCASLANLFLVNTTERHAEFAVRAALGAGRARLARQVLVEAGVVATAGSIAGIALAFATSAWLRSLAAPVLPAERPFGLDYPDLLAALAVGWLTALVFGTVPALVAARVGAPGMTHAATQASASPRLGGLRSSLVGAQVLCAVLLLTGSGLLIRSYANAMSVPVGFDARGVLTTELHLREGSSAEVARRFRGAIRRVESELAATAGGVPVAFSTSAVFSGGGSVRWDLRLPGANEYLRRSIHVKYVSHDYFSVLGIPTRRGRAFRPDENGSAPAAVVSEGFVRQFGQGRDLLGGELRSPALSYAVVGVVGDVRTTWLTQPARPTVYLPIESTSSTSLTIVAHAAKPVAVIPVIRDAVRRVNPDGPSVEVEPLEAIVWRSEERRRFYLVVVSLFAVLSGTVAAVGIYGVVARSTALKARELGIRLALGAHPAGLVRSVVTQGLRPVVVGGLPGLVGAWWTTRLLEATPVFGLQLFQIRAHDPSTFVLVPAGVVTVALVAAWLPARRVSRLDPTVVLRDN